MKFCKRFVFSIIATSLLMFTLPSAAATLYRHLPLEIKLSSGDTLIIDYDFKHHRGIRCKADNNNVWIDFMYKGNEKSVFLPITLQNSHVPKQTTEELADKHGQLRIFIDKQTENLTTIVNCRYY